jgi:ubiquinone/menaquinone biosynthesis C-methylase UbiE
MTTTAPTGQAGLAPNHHADHPAFAGVGGLVAALTFAIGRTAAADLAIRLTEVAPDDDVLDVGCGPGVAVHRAAARGASSVVGVDPAPVMLRVARALGTLHRRTPAGRYLEGTAEALPLPDCSATVLWSLSTVHHWHDITAGLEEARRVLRPSGRLLAIERRVAPGASGLGAHGWTEDQARRFADQCLSAGFTDVDIGHHRPRSKPVLTVSARRP